MQALKDGRIGIFAFFDFAFFAMRVHSGDDQMEWDGHTWQGIGEVLKKNFTWKKSAFPLSVVDKNKPYEPDYFMVSLPLNKETSEVVSKGYYRGRRMELLECSLDEEGGILERIDYFDGVITECTIKGNIIVFRGEDDALASVEGNDARHKETVEAARQQFKWDLSDTASSGAIGWVMNAIGVCLGNVFGTLVDVLTMFIPAKRRAIVSRWQARKRVYHFTTTPKIPRIWTRRKGYRIRADTLDEAKMKLYGEVIAKIWMFPVEYIQMIVYCDGRPLEFFNLDYVRKHDDPKRWEEISPLKRWGKA